MASQPQAQKSQGGGIGCGCLFLVIALVLAVGYRVFIFKGDETARPQAGPASTTVKVDDKARLGCFEWWEADDPSILTTEEAEARRAEGLAQAADSSVASVADAARKAQTAYENDPPFEEFSVT